MLNPSEHTTDSFDMPTSPWTEVFQAAQEQSETQTPARQQAGAQTMPQSGATANTANADDPTHHALSTIFNGN